MQFVDFGEILGSLAKVITACGAHKLNEGTQMNGNGKFQWIAAWDQAGFKAREREVSDLLPIIWSKIWDLPLSKIWGLPVDETKLMASNYTDNPIKHEGADSDCIAALTRPAWTKDSKIVYGITVGSWDSPETAEAWLGTDPGKAWVSHSLGYTLLQTK